MRSFQYIKRPLDPLDVTRWIIDLRQLMSNTTEELDLENVYALARLNQEIYALLRQAERQLVDLRLNIELLRSDFAERTKMRGP